MKKVVFSVCLAVMLTLISCGSERSGRRSDERLTRSALTEEQVVLVKDAYPGTTCAFALPWSKAYLDPGLTMRATDLGFSELLVVGNTHDDAIIAVKRTPTKAPGYQVLYVDGLTDKLEDAQEAWRLHGRIHRQPSPILPVPVSGRFCPGQLATTTY